MGVVGRDTKGHELEELRGELDAQARALEAKEEQLERYASDLRETFKQERAAAEELRANYVATVRALTNAVEARDAYTGKHAERVAAYGLELAAVIEPSLTEDPEVEFGFLLHDVGKVAIPDRVLHKPQPLEGPERSLIERHPAIGSEILEGIGFLEHARQIVRAHHERWDGDGYPDGLKGEEIPLPARIFSVADALDAITTDRPYRPGASFAAARAEIAQGAGTQFDPAVVTALERLDDATLERLRAEIG